jgi:glycosyltransferase involved in cell wall biosynthesis
VDDLPLVTVVIPTWNRLPLLKQAVASVVEQTHPRWELIVADDGSTDGTGEWVDSRADARIRHVPLPRTGHIGAVRNRGAAAGKGDVVAFLDSDDVWLPHKLDAQLRAMRDAGARWCYGGYELMDDAGATVPFRGGGPWVRDGRIVREVLMTEIGVGLSTLVVDRALFDGLGGFSEDPRLAYRGDHELALRLALNADAAAVPDVVTRLREHVGRSTHALADAHERTARVYELFLEMRPPSGLARIARRVHARHLADAAAHRVARGEHAAAARLLARSLRESPDPLRAARAVASGVRARLAG